MQKVKGFVILFCQIALKCEIQCFKSIQSQSYLKKKNSYLPNNGGANNNYKSKGDKYNGLDLIISPRAFLMVFAKVKMGMPRLIQTFVNGLIGFG